MYSTVQYSTVQYSTVQHSTVQYSTVQYSTVQHSTAQYSTEQYSTVQYLSQHDSPVSNLFLVSYTKSNALRSSAVSSGCQKSMITTYLSSSDLLSKMFIKRLDPQDCIVLYCTVLYCTASYQISNNKQFQSMHLPVSCVNEVSKTRTLS